MLPMNSKYYTNNIDSIDNNKFVYFRGNVCLSYKEIAMCYNVALPMIWKEIFEIESVNDIIERISNISNKSEIVKGHGKKGWNTDQLYLYESVNNWNNKTNNFICLRDSDTGFNRLCRAMNFSLDDDNIRNNISNGKYSDYHCYRPMENFTKLNYEIFNLLPTK